MRRLIASILAILALTLSCFPCCDVDARPLTGEEITTLIKAVSADDCGAHHDADICSPFCACTCCAGFALPQVNSFVIKAIPVQAEKAFPAYSPQFAQEVHYSIWQPPQLV